MERVIMIKYGELSTKKGNINFFIRTLYQNVQKKLKNFNTNIYKDTSRMYIEFDDNDLEKVLFKMNQIFGIHEYLVAYKISCNVDEIEHTLLDILKQQTFTTFKVETKRSDKSFPISSLDFSKQMGGVVLKKMPHTKVDVHHPELLIHIEIRHNYTYIYVNHYKGLGGYPNGTLGKGMLMLSGGIDSPVAGFLALKRGMLLEAVYFEAIPHTSIEARNKVIALSKKLALYTNKIKLHIIPFTEIQESIYKNIDATYCITIMRRMMYRIMEKLAKMRSAQVIVNGESIGQVASQTLTSMQVINEVTNYPIIRPVACLDKLEIIDLAKKIDTYEISILPYEDCCTIFVPKHPIINPNLDDAIKFEESFDYNSLIDMAIKNRIIMDITAEDDNIYQDLL